MTDPCRRKVKNFQNNPPLAGRPAACYTEKTDTVQKREEITMQVSPKQILRMEPNKVDYLIPGGEMINEFLGDGPGLQVCSQLWLASLVTSACPAWRGRTNF